MCQAAERERANLEEELRKERAARKQHDEKMRELEQRVRASQASSSAMSASPDKRKLELLEKQVAQLRQDKQREEMRRLEAESTLKSVERRANELQSQVYLSMFAQGVQNPWTVANLDFGLSLHTGIDVDVKCVQMEQMHLQGRGGVDPNRLVQLEQQLQNSEERRKEEEKKRAIAEGKHRHLENQMKQQVHVLCAKRVAITT